jgi:hypothetical protein
MRNENEGFRPSPMIKNFLLSGYKQSLMGGQERIRFGSGAPEGADRALPKTAVVTFEASSGCERSPETPYCESVSQCPERQSGATSAMVGQAPPTVQPRAANGPVHTLNSRFAAPEGHLPGFSGIS